MQYQGLSHRQGYLAFENIVPKETSTRHVAAAAFYHCLSASFCFTIQGAYSFSAGDQGRAAIGAARGDG